MSYCYRRRSEDRYVDSACDGFLDHGQWHLKGIVPEQGSFGELACGSGDCRICRASTIDGGRWSSDWQLRAWLWQYDGGMGRKEALGSKEVSQWRSGDYGFRH